MARSLGHAIAIVRSRRHILTLILLALLPYANALQAGFALDDEVQIQTNPAVTSRLDLTQIVTVPLAPGSIFRPLTVLTFAANEWLSPGAPALFHAANVLLHAGVTLLVYLLALRLFQNRRAAFVGAALFAVHPIHTEAVTSLVGRAEVLAALCGVGALLSVARSEAAVTEGSRIAFRMLSVLLFFLAVMSKESAVTVLPLIVLFRITMRGETAAAGLWRELRSLDWVPYTVCALVFIIWRYAVTVFVELTPLDNVLVFVPWTVRVRSALAVLWDYFGLLHVPLVLAADYSYNQVPVITSWWAPRFWAGMGLVTVAVGYCVRRRWTGLTFAVAFPFVALALTANVLFPIGTIKAERFLYLPSVGWAVVAGWSLDWLLQQRRQRALVLTLVCLLVVAFATRTWVRNWDWYDNSVLYQSMARDAPENAKARYDFGVLLQTRGETAAASVQFHRALDIYPWAEGAALGIAVGFEQTGHTDAAVQWYHKALEIVPSFMLAHRRLCRLLHNAERPVEAAQACRAGLRYRPTDPQLLKGLGASLVATGAGQSGIEVLHRSLVWNPQDDELRDYLTRFDASSTGQSADAERSGPRYPIEAGGLALICAR